MTNRGALAVGGLALAGVLAYALSARAKAKGGHGVGPSGGSGGNTAGGGGDDAMDGQWLNDQVGGAWASVQTCLDTHDPELCRPAPGILRARAQKIRNAHYVDQSVADAARAAAGELEDAARQIESSTRDVPGNRRGSAGAGAGPRGADDIGGALG